jgi:hypothetical protein
MKWVKNIGILFGIIMLFGCVKSIPEKASNIIKGISEHLSGIPSTVTIEGTTYRNGFYEGLYPVYCTYSTDRTKVGSNYFRRVNYEKIDCVKFSNDGTVMDIIYCADGQWEQAHAYYADRDNFVYYCKIGRENIYRDSVIEIIKDIEHEMFDKLMVFADENGYNPFNPSKKIITHRLPFPNNDESPELTFYRESNDGYFTSSKENKFYVVNNKLLLVYFYDYGHGEYEELVAVDVPDKLGQYFIELFAKSLING